MRGKSLHASRGEGRSPRVNFHLRPDTLEAVRRVAAREGITVSQLLRRWVECRAEEEASPV